MWQTQTGDQVMVPSKMGSGHLCQDWIETNFNLPVLFNIFWHNCSLCRFFRLPGSLFFEERAAVVKNKKHFFSKRALVQWMDHAQPGCLRVEAPACWLKAQKIDSVLGTWRWANNWKHYLPKRALVQCMDHAQPECLHVGAPTCWLKATK